MLWVIVEIFVSDVEIVSVEYVVYKFSCYLVGDQFGISFDYCFEQG